MQAKTLRNSAVALAVAGAFASGVFLADEVGLRSADAASAAVVPTAPARSVAALPDFAEMVAKYGPAVVQISVSGTRKMSSRGMPDLNEMFPDLPNMPGFRHFQIPRMPDAQPMQGVGSGFILSGDGIVLTNAHVVDDADEVMVRLTDRREFKAKVLGKDKMTDVAVLRIDAKDLPTVKVGNPEATRVGEWVVAIGAPFGLDNTVTAGIVSAKARSLPGGAAVPFIQTDAAVNPGNSGGPLFNLNGEVIGINSQIFSRSGGFQGLAFAIPIDVAMNVTDQIRHHGKAEHGRLGVSIQEVNPALAESFRLQSARGALVAAVQKDSPAAKAGIEPGDVIVKMNGREINRSIELPPLVAALKPGSKIDLEVWHEGKTRNVAVAIGSFEDEKETLASAQDGGAASGKLGVAVRPLTSDEKRSAEIANGVVVEQVGGAAAKAGVREGDVILSVNRTPVRSPEQLRELVSKSGKSVALLVQREDARIFIPVTIG